MSLLFKKLKQKTKKIADPPKNAFLSFEKNLNKFLSSHFAFVLALKTIDTQMFFYIKNKKNIKKIKCSFIHYFENVKCEKCERKLHANFHTKNINI